MVELAAQGADGRWSDRPYRNRGRKGKIEQSH